MKCTCDYPSKEHDTWTGHSPLCPIEKRSRENPSRRVKQRTGRPTGLPRWLEKVLDKEASNNG